MAPSARLSLLGSNPKACRMKPWAMSAQQPLFVAQRRDLAQDMAIAQPRHSLEMGCKARPQRSQAEPGGQDGRPPVAKSKSQEPRSLGLCPARGLDSLRKSICGFQSQHLTQEPSEGAVYRSVHAEKGTPAQGRCLMASAGLHIAAKV